jgi:glycosyltransferase involved in cell wall biosynthesis
MTICVLATVATETGALTIYKQFLNALERFCGEYNWQIFIADGMPTPTIPNVSYHICHTKGLDRMKFDLYGFNQQLKKKGIVPNVVFSLQNGNARCKASRYVIYFHQALALSKYRVNLGDKFAKTYLFYHYFYPLYVKLFLNKHTYVAVQTNKIKNVFSKRFNFPKEKVGVFFPETEKIDGSNLDSFKFEDGTYNFVYPATPFAFKEHISLAFAMKELYQQNPTIAEKIRIHFTLSLGEVVEMDKYIVENGLKRNIVYHGRIPHKQLLSMVKCSNGLLFPSMIETLGLPLLEAASLGVPVIANDLEYVHEVLNGYKGVKYVAVHDYKDWAEKILSCCSNTQYAPYVLPEDNSWERLIKLITEGIIDN